MSLARIATNITPVNSISRSPRRLVARWQTLPPLQRGLILLIPMNLLAGSIAYTAYQTWREFDWQTVALLIAAPLVYSLPILMSWPFRDDPVRFVMPALPFLIISAIYILRPITRKFVLKQLNARTESKIGRTL